MLISDLETPALLVDIDVMERNLCRAADYARKHSLRLRPHTKTHKVPALGKRQLELGAAGLTVAKVSEAEVMAAAQPPDLLIAYPVIGRRKLARLTAVAARTPVIIAVDSVEAGRQLSEAASAAGVSIGVLAEMDVGLARVGVPSGAPLVELAKQLAALPGLRFDGLAFYPGHIKQMDQEGERAIAAVGEKVSATLSGLRAAGLEAHIVSGGSTPALFHSHRVPGITEIRPGTYIFNDKNTVLSGACEMGDCAASVLTTVVSTAIPGQIIVDGGSKTFSSDRLGSRGEATFGHVLEAPEAVFAKMNEEHGFLDIRETGKTFRVGDRLRIIPNHICTAVNLHEKMYGVRGERVLQVWEVAGRGKLQ